MCIITALVPIVHNVENILKVSFNSDRLALCRTVRLHC